ncbi:MAG: TonB-dependent receptor, partial [Allosphingosinicella sp.]
WTISAGRLTERVLATGAMLTDTAFRDRSGWEPTGRAGIAWRAADGLTLRGAAYLGWRLPTLNELYRPFRVGADATAANAELAPERLRGVEAGLDWRPAPRARIGFTVFANRLEGAIANVTLGRGPGVFPGVGFVAAGGDYRQRANLDSIEVRGMELEGRYALGAWTISGGWSWVDGEVKADGAALALDGLRPAQTPRHSLSSTLAWAGGGGARASVTARYAGAQYEDDLNRQTLPGAFTLDAVGRLPLGRKLAIEARAENVANARILAGINGDGIEERATPRTFWIGLRFGGLR